MKNIVCIVFLALFGCKNNSSDYSELVIHYKGEGGGTYKIYISPADLNIGTECSNNFRNQEIFDKCLKFYGANCFVEMPPPYIPDTLCPKGCNGRCMIGVLK